jgi:YbgC/YbaW family acyl-CoA thioester hydrolase
MVLDAFRYDRRVAFADTDAMGVVHHANYLRYCEEARVSWMRSRDLVLTHFPQTERILAVIHYQVWHMKPCTFDDALRIFLQVRGQGLKAHFQYAMYKGDVRICEAETLHITVDKQLRPVRPAPEFSQILEKEKWTETWLSNS